MILSKFNIFFLFRSIESLSIKINHLSYLLKRFIFSLKKKDNISFLFVKYIQFHKKGIVIFISYNIIYSL